MERYIAHALSLESGDTRRITGKPKSRNETPSPRSKSSPTARNIKWGNWAAVGSTPMSAGGKRTGPSMKAGTATSAVIIATFTEVFIDYLSFFSAMTGSRRKFVSFVFHRAPLAHPFPALRINQLG